MRQTNQPVSVSDAIPDVMAKLNQMAARAKVFADHIRPQFDAEPESVPCEKHPRVARIRDWDATLQESHSREDFRMMYSPCPECAEGARKEADRRKWAKRGVPERLAEATLENFVTHLRDPSLFKAVTKTRDWLTLVKAKGGFLLLLGQPGLGKGHIAVGAMKLIGSGFYITHPDLLTELRASYTLHTTDALLEKYRTTPCLVLDELGVSGGGKDEQPILYQILADRHDAKLPTIITSNEELPRVKEILGHRIMDRIREDHVLCNFKGQSYRGSSRQPK